MSLWIWVWAGEAGFDVVTVELVARCFQERPLSAHLDGIEPVPEAPGARFWSGVCLGLGVAVLCNSRLRTWSVVYRGSRCWGGVYPGTWAGCRGAEALSQWSDW